MSSFARALSLPLLSVMIALPSTSTAAAAPAASAAPIATETPTTPTTPAPTHATTTPPTTTSTKAPGCGDDDLQRALQGEWNWDHRDGDASADLRSAAFARACLGHRAHAVRYLRAYLAEAPNDDEARERLSSLEQGLVPLEVVVQADPRDSALILELTAPQGPTDVLPRLLVDLEISDHGDGRQHGTVLLTPGTWTVTIPEDSYYADDALEITIAQGVAQTIELRPDVPMPPGGRPRTLGIRAASSPFVLGAVGIGLLVGGQSQFKATLTASPTCDSSPVACADLISRAANLRSSGAGLLGASLGVTTALISGMAPTRRRRAIVWGIEAGVGLGALIGGAVGVSAASRRVAETTWSAWDDPTFRADVTGTTARHTASALVLGYGTSLLVYSLYYLARDQLHAKIGERRRRGALGRIFAIDRRG